MKYEKLSADDQKAMLESRLVALEREHFDNTISEANAAAMGEVEAAEQFKKNQVDIDKVYAEVKKQLTKLG